MIRRRLVQGSIALLNVCALASQIKRPEGEAARTASMSPHTMSCCLSIVVLIALSASLRTRADIIPASYDCRSAGAAPSPQPAASHNATENSMFQRNLAALLDAIPSAAAAAAAGGFASRSMGDGGDRAFVRALCFGHALGSCQGCLINAAANIKGECNSRRAAAWFEGCFLSYADTNSSTAHEETYRFYLNNRYFVSDKVAFERTYEELVSRLVARAVNGSSESAAPVPLFATGHEVFDRAAPSPNGTMYGLVQCMRDRTAAECRRCLQGSVPEFSKCCYGRQGVVVVGYNCYLRMEIYTYYDLALDAPPSSLIPVNGERQGNKGPDVILAIALPVGTVLFVISILVLVFLYKRKAGQKQTPYAECCDEEEADIGNVGLDQINLQLLRAATDNFSEENKLGKGGFGEVFKGTLQSGEQIAVKRLSKRSSQGFHELKNELVLAAKLKHRNLAPIVGLCLQEEKLLVYEYMPNSSLDTFLFDPVKRQLLDWSKRFMIICGIARGLRYLHEESRLKVIHRDLKPSNVLLDADMNPKISDFGLARAFEGDQSRDVTKRPAGTLGYMSPEYAYCGHVSTKSDMFSFGVIVLEIVTGRKSNSTYDYQATTSLLSYVWRKWSTGSAADVVDPSLGGQYPEDEVLNCIEVGLLCVQENPTDRPDASAVVLMLGNYSSSAPDEGRRKPARPAFFFGGAAVSSSRDALMGDGEVPSVPSSGNVLTISDFQPR